tara:strand:+ start:181 stop:519 length:339 start_codon:yes stop_codon:yes gene_type:complete
MKDPTVPNLEDRKKIMFYDSAHRQAKLKIRCDFDGITQSQFFRLMITGYIEDDDLIHKFLDMCKEKYKFQGKNKRDKINRIRQKSTQLKKNFSLDKNEIENIFDTIEQETNL